MPTTDKGIRTPADSLKISALGGAMRDMAADIDSLLTVHDPYAGGGLPDFLEQRLEFLARLAAEPGSVRINAVLDPVPLDAVANYLPSRARMNQAPGWGRIICETVGATYFRPKLDAPGGDTMPVNVGAPFAASVQVRAQQERNQKFSLTVQGYTPVNGVMGSPTAMASTGWVSAAANIAKTLSVTGTVPAGITHMSMQVTFARDPGSYPEVGDFAYFRQVLLVAGEDVENPPAVTYFNGDSPESYWLGLPNKSGSLTAAPRGSGADGGSAFRRDAIVDAGIKRRGGVIGTAGKAAVALRFDHHLPAFKSKILPLLKEYRLPWGQMLNPARIASGGEGMTYAQIATECYNTGGEAWHHSYSHTDMPDAATANREVIRGFDDLRAGLPGLYIDGWAGPGQTVQMGLEGSDTPEKFWGSYPGRLVLERHAFVRGYYSGVYQPLAGPNLIGAPHSTIDTLDAAYVSGLVRGAIAAGAGLTLMLHPNYLDTAGYMTTAALRTILADLAAKRDAGELLMLTPTAILLADASSDYRRNLLTTGGAGAKNGTWTETVSNRSGQTQYGVPHELVVTVRAKTAGRVMLNLKETGTPRFDALHSVDLAAGAVATLRCLATLPLDCAGIVANLTGNIDHSDIELHAV